MSKRPHGRPTTWSEEIGEQIFNAMVGITEPGKLMAIHQACAVVSTDRYPEGVPVGTAYEWLMKPGHEFSEIHALARMVQAEIEFDTLRGLEAQCIIESRTEPRMAWAYRAVIENRLKRLAFMSSKYSPKPGIAESEVRKMVVRLAQRLVASLERQVKELAEALEGEGVEDEARERVISSVHGQDATILVKELLEEMIND